MYKNGQFDRTKKTYHVDIKLQGDGASLDPKNGKVLFTISFVRTDRGQPILRSVNSPMNCHTIQTWIGKEDYAEIDERMR